MKNNLIYLFILFSSWTYTLQAQSESDFIFFESRLQTLANKILTASSDSLKDEANKLLIEDIEEVLLLRGSFHYTFNNIDKLSVLTSPDKKFKIFNWVVPKGNGDFEYYAYLQFYKKRKKELYFFKLNDISSFIDDEQYKMFTDGDWYGALYSNIVHTKFEKQNYYTLLGWDGNNSSTTKRIIDILYFDENEEPVFGAPIIKMNDGTRHRMILEYSKNTSTSMGYDEDKEYIVFDHLEPLEGAQKGMYEFYVPSLSYDGLTFKNGKWRFVEDLPAMNDKSQDGKQAKNIQRGLQSQ